MTIDPKPLAIAFIKARKEQQNAERRLEDARKALDRMEKDARMAEVALCKLAESQQLKSSDIAIQDGDKLYLVNIQGNGALVRELQWAEIPQPKAEYVG